MCKEASTGAPLTIKSLAERVRNRYFRESVSGSSVALALNRLVEEIGGRIRSTSSPDYRETSGGSLEIREIRDFTIWLSPYTSDLRDNFTVAHEIGHYLIHYDPNDGRKKYHRYGSGREESEANMFAAELLMPAEPFKLAYENGVRYTSGKFGVSGAAVEARADYLNLDRDGR